MAPRFHLALIVLLCSSHLVAPIRRAFDNDDSPLAAYVVSVRRPYGLVGVDEPEALEQWHTNLLEQVCNTSDPATAERFPTAESRLINSYSHVVSGFSAWLTRPEVELLSMLPWFIEAVQDKSYKLMSVDAPETASEPSWLDDVRDGVWSTGNMGDGMIIGVLDAGADDGRLLVGPEAEGIHPPPEKWKGRCDRAEACNNRLIGLRTFVNASRALGADTSVPGIEYDTAFAVAPKAHLAIYHVCDEECHPNAVKAGMDAAVDDGVDVVWMFVGAAENDTAFHEDAVAAPSYGAVTRGVLVCAPAGSSGPDMLEAESSAPWLLTVAASDADCRVVTNAELGSGVLKPDVSAPSGAEDTDAQLREAASAAAAHVTGVAALFRKAHPDWSPAAVKSALVTTADPIVPGDALETEASGASYIVTGAGEVNPAKAMDPGLVYDLAAGDFIKYLCGINLGEDRVREIVGPSMSNTPCAETGAIAAKDLNYPSIMVAMDDGLQQVEAKRTVTNVGDAAETYRAQAAAAGVDVAVSPSTLEFTGVGQKADFVVTVRRQASTPTKAVIEGELKWVSEKHVVQSPMVVVVGETAAASSVSYSHDAES